MPFIEFVRQLCIYEQICRWACVAFGISKRLVEFGWGSPIFYQRMKGRKKDFVVRAYGTFNWTTCSVILAYWTLYWRFTHSTTVEIIHIQRTTNEISPLVITCQNQFLRKKRSANISSRESAWFICFGIIPLKLGE